MPRTAGHDTSPVWNQRRRVGMSPSRSAAAASMRSSATVRCPNVINQVLVVRPSSAMTPRCDTRDSISTTPAVNRSVAASTAPAVAIRMSSVVHTASTSRSVTAARSARIPVMAVGCS